MQRWLRRLRPRSDAAATPVVATPTATLPFSEVEGVLALYTTALSQGTLRVRTSPSAGRGSYCDGRTIFLPPSLDLFADTAHAQRLYRVMVAWKVAQFRSGCLEAEELLVAEHPGAALALYEVLAGEWVDRHLVQLWPGLTADLRWLRKDAAERRTSDGPHPFWEELLRTLLAWPLSEPVTQDTLASLPSFTSLSPAAREVLGQVPAALAAPEPSACRTLARRLAPLLPTPAESETDEAVHYRGRIRADLLRRTVVSLPDDDVDAHATSAATAPPPRPTPQGIPLHVAARRVEPPRPRERRASEGGRQAVQLSLGDREPPVTFAQVPLSDEEKRGAKLFDEWDYLRGIYLPEWCALRERRPRAGDPEPVERILRQHRPLVTRIKQQFEALRPERLRLTRQYDGDELDIEAIVADHADRRAGFAPEEKLYSRTLERERNIALGCLVDLSGSTGAWIDDDPRNDQVIEVTRRALVFLCEALTVLDDRYAIFGFTGSTRKHCELNVVKGFSEQYGETVKGRIAGLAPGAYTRIGPAIRYTTQALTQQPARVRLLLLISDGRPNDFDGYGGRYGIEDTRRALREARQQGVVTFALTIDAEARDYMPYMFGPTQYVVVEDAPALAVKLADVYRRLTVQ